MDPPIFDALRPRGLTRVENWIDIEIEMCGGKNELEDSNLKKVFSWMQKMNSWGVNPRGIRLTLFDNIFPNHIDGLNFTTKGSNLNLQSSSNRSDGPVINQDGKY